MSLTFVMFCSLSCHVLVMSLSDVLIPLTDPRLSFKVWQCPASQPGVWQMHRLLSHCKYLMLRVLHSLSFFMFRLNAASDAYLVKFDLLIGSCYSLGVLFWNWISSLNRERGFPTLFLCFNSMELCWNVSEEQRRHAHCKKSCLNHMETI